MYLRICAGSILLLTSVLCGRAVPGPVDKPSAEPPAAVLENQYCRYAIAADSTSLWLRDKQSGKDRCAAKARHPLARLRKAGATYSSTVCSAKGDRLTLGFDRLGATMVLKATSKPRYLVFEVESISDADVDGLMLLNLPVTMGRYVSSMSGLAADEEFAACVRALDLRSFAQVGGNPVTLTASASRQPGLVGAKVALVACPAVEIRMVLKELIEAEGLPKSPLGGPWALDAPENRGSYVFALVSEKNADDWIALAKKAGIAQIHFHGWEQSLGHYRPRKDLFPNGMAGLKATVDKIHAAGLRAGMHTLTGCISPNDPWVTPVPDKRLAVDATLTLAASVDPKTQILPTVEQPPEFDTLWAYASRGNVVRVGDELIQFTGLSREPPYGLTGCRRGAFGTKPAAHEKGATVSHLFVRYTSFQPDENSTLVDDLADKIAEVFNTCGFDMIYMDGAEGMAGGWYGEARMRAAIFRKLQRRALVEASSWDYLSWPFHSRIGAWDHPNWALKRFIDIHCKANEGYRRSSLLPAQLGWWAILGPSRDHPAEMPDEIEYLCAKALAFDSPMSFQGVNVGAKPWNARQDEYMELIGRYERLRLSGYFSQAVKEQLKSAGQDFHLIQAADGTWEFIPTDYSAHRVTGPDDGSDRWTVTNRFPAQPLKLRIEALYSVQPYDTPDALVLADFDKPQEFSAGSGASGVVCGIESSREMVKAGTASGRYYATNKGPSRRGAWAVVPKPFRPPVSLKANDALGVWIHGDGKGELLNFQLTNPTQFWPTFDEHYVKVDFTGWRYFELLLRERDAEAYGDYVWPYGDIYSVYRSPLIRDHVSALKLYFNNLPPGETVTCMLSPIKALQTVKAKLRHPAVIVNGRQIVFPVTLESGCWLEFTSSADCKLYDERGAMVQHVKVDSEVPTLAAGQNELRFACEAPPGLRARAKVTVISSGPALRNTAAK